MIDDGNSYRKQYNPTKSVTRHASVRDPHRKRRSLYGRSAATLAALFSAIAAIAACAISFFQLQAMWEQSISPDRNQDVRETIQAADKVCAAIGVLKVGFPIFEKSKFDITLIRDDLPDSAIFETNAGQIAKITDEVRNLRLAIRMLNRWASEDQKSSLDAINLDVNLRLDPANWVRSFGNNDEFVRASNLAQFDCASNFPKAIDEWAISGSYESFEMGGAMIIDRPQRNGMVTDRQESANSLDLQ